MNILITTLILFQVNINPSLSLGPVGTIFVIIVLIILGIITWRQRNWKNAADAAALTSNSAITEMNLYKGIADRLREEKKEIDERFHKMEARTDLAPLVVAQQTNTEIIKKWVEEGRKRFEDARLSLDKNTQALTTVLEETKAQRVTSEDSYRALTTSFLTHTLDDKEYQLRLMSMMAAIEGRLSEVAVQIGKTKWNTTRMTETIEEAKSTILVKKD